MSYSSLFLIFKSILTLLTMLAHQDRPPYCISGSAYLRQHTLSHHWQVWGCHMFYSASSDLRYMSYYSRPSYPMDPSYH